MRILAVWRYHPFTHLKRDVLSLFVYQPVIRLRTSNKVHSFCPMQDFCTLGLCHASCNANLHGTIGFGTCILELSNAANIRINLLSCLFPNMACV